MNSCKKTFRQILLQDPTAHVKGYTLSNLATACWWEKYPNYHNYNPLDYDDDEDIEVGDLEAETLRDKDYEQVIPLYKNALFFLENMRQKLDTKKGEDMLKFLKIKNLSESNFDQYVGCNFRFRNSLSLKTSSSILKTQRQVSCCLTLLNLSSRRKPGTKL
jgi:hypothetical protein